MIAATMDVSTDRMPRAERDAVLARLRRERDDARRTLLAETGQGWACDVAAVQQPRRRLDPGDVDRVLAGEPLPPHRTGGDEDAARRLAALDVAIKRLAQQHVEDDAVDLQRQADEVTARLRTLVADVLKNSNKLGPARSVETALDDLKVILASRDGLHHPDVANVPLVGHDPGLEEVAYHVWRALDLLEHARRELDG